MKTMKTDEVIRLTVAALKSLVKPGGTKKNCLRLRVKSIRRFMCFVMGRRLIIGIRFFLEEEIPRLPKEVRSKPIC